MNKDRADKIFANINSKLAKEKGKIVAIEVNTGDYFIGEDELEAYEKAIEQHPSSEFFFKRIGSKTAFFVGFQK
ncbi:hypothetical protein COV18_05305 [Candidatus Woesearchaeota archaeon CG10_big_fil_rev_8_21_14_0_10_37_12]|nr:MAG: hypothetical protein COV18_05305 [Candidatus Woesearchaeota archaeon CG10_big_fil_rev_8_21_14_0_10_37_12]